MGYDGFTIWFLEQPRFWPHLNMVDGDWNMFYDFPDIGNFITPTDELHHFQRGSNHQPVNRTMITRWSTLIHLIDLCAGTLHMSTRYIKTIDVYTRIYIYMYVYLYTFVQLRIYSSNRFGTLWYRSSQRTG